MNKSIATFMLTAAASFSLAVFASGCNGGSSTQVSTVGTNPTPLPIYTPPTGGGGSPCGGGCTNGVCPEYCVVSGPILHDPTGPSTGSTADSNSEGLTRDTDLQQSQLQQASIATRAVNIQNEFGMSVQSASQLAVLADHVQQMTANSQELTTDDRNAITESALSIANISMDEVNDAFTKSMQGDNTATEALLQKAAVNLGMQSSASVRTQLLPALGVEL